LRRNGVSDGGDGYTRECPCNGEAASSEDIHRLGARLVVFVFVAAMLKGPQLDLYQQIN
jgi:hypothetical protein